MTYTSRKFLGPILYETTEHYSLSSDERGYIKSTMAGRNSEIIGGGKRHSRDLQILQREELSSLSQWIQGHINNFAHDVYTITNDVEFYITDSWVNHLMPGAEHVMHSHSNSIISGVLFIGTEGNNQPLYFGTDINEVFRGFEFPYNDMQYENVNHEDGKLVMFPSKVAHGVPPVALDRWSLSFNTFFRGTVGGGQGVNVGYGNQLTLT